MCVWLAILVVLLGFVVGEVLYCSVVCFEVGGGAVLWCCWGLGYLFKLVLGYPLAKVAGDV